jgi:hypothetical protein
LVAAYSGAAIGAYQITFTSVIAGVDCTRATTNQSASGRSIGKCHIIDNFTTTDDTGIGPFRISCTIFFLNNFTTNILLFFKWLQNY